MQGMRDSQDLNQLILNMGEKFRAEIAQPIGPSPTHLPVNQSFSLAVTHAWLTFPQAVRKRLQSVSPEDLAQRGKRLGSKVSPLSIWMLGYFFLVGREIMLDFGAQEDTGREDIADVLDYWRRLSAAHRGDGHLDNSDAGFMNRFLPHSLVEQLYQDLVPADMEMRRLVQQFFSVLEAYLFQLNAEAHLGMADSGPYPLSPNRVLIVRDFFDLKGRWYPWRETVADLPYATCSLAFTLDPADFQNIEISDRGALLTSPADYTQGMHEISIVTNDSGQPRVLPFTEMDRLARDMKKLQPQLARWFSRLSHRESIIQGIRPWVLRPYATIANDEDCFSWEPAPEALQLLPLYEDDDARAARWATHRCLAPDRSTFVPVAD